MSSYREVLGGLFARANFGIKLELGPVQELLRAMGDALPPRGCLLVAGTNGKGSTSAFLAAALERHGLRVGLFQSPHLLRFVERIRIDDEPIAEEWVPELVAAMQHAERSCTRPATFFEAATAMAMRAFAEHQVDVAVLEVGLGGRLDATNAVAHQNVAMTPIGRDHENILGHGLVAIATEKAAVIPQGGVVVSAPQSPECMEILARVARERACTLVVAEPVVEVGQVGRAGQVGQVGAMPYFQYTNLAVALTLYTQFTGQLGSDALIAHCLAHTPKGRYQWLGQDVLLDGAHNPHAAAALREAMAHDVRGQRPYHLVFSCKKDKDPVGFLSELQPASVQLCAIAGERALSLQALADRIPEGRRHETAGQAIAAARERAAADGGFVLVTGSLFLVADALAHLTDAPRDPPVEG